MFDRELRDQAVDVILGLLHRVEGPRIERVLAVATQGYAEEDRDELRRQLYELLEICAQFVGVMALDWGNAAAGTAKEAWLRQLREQRARLREMPEEEVRRPGHLIPRPPVSSSARVVARGDQVVADLLREAPGLARAAKTG